MAGRILLAVATSDEAKAFLAIPGIKVIGGGFAYLESKISIIKTGVGSVSTAWALTKWISSNLSPDIAINIGIAGSYAGDINVGDVVMPVSDCFADAGIETREGFMTLSEAGLADPDLFPYNEGKIIADNIYISRAKKLLKPVKAITVNTATGTTGTIEKMRRKFNPDIETMEGAAFFYICSKENIPFLSVRSVSNRVEPREKSNWNIPLAIANLSGKLKELFEEIC